MHYSFQIIYTYDFSEPLHVTNQVRQRGVVNPYYFAIYLDDLSLELNNIKGECCIGEILLNHLIFADDICVFWTSVRGLQGTLDVCQAYAESPLNYSQLQKDYLYDIKAKNTRSTAIPLLTLWCMKSKICFPLQIFGDCTGYWAFRWQRHSETSAISNASLFRCSNAVKNVLFHFCCTPMYASQLWYDFRKSRMQRLCVAYNFGCTALYNLPWRARVSSHQVQCNIPTFEALLRTNV